MSWIMVHIHKCIVWFWKKRKWWQIFTSIDLDAENVDKISAAGKQTVYYTSNEGLNVHLYCTLEVLLW